jgi:hypothetical protein
MTPETQTKILAHMRNVLGKGQWSEPKVSTDAQGEFVWAKSDTGGHVNAIAGAVTPDGDIVAILHEGKTPKSRTCLALYASSFN